MTLHTQAKRVFFAPRQLSSASRASLHHSVSRIGGLSHAKVRPSTLSPSQPIPYLQTFADNRRDCTLILIASLSMRLCVHRLAQPVRSFPSSTNPRTNPCSRIPALSKHGASLRPAASTLSCTKSGFWSRSRGGVGRSLISDAQTLWDTSDLYVHTPAPIFLGTMQWPGDSLCLQHICSSSSAELSFSFLSARDLPSQFLRDFETCALILSLVQLPKKRSQDPQEGASKERKEAQLLESRNGVMGHVKQGCRGSTRQKRSSAHAHCNSAPPGPPSLPCTRL